jgi:hypothetical protein
LKEQVAEVGDFVWADGFICRAIEIRKSKYGYTNYRLRYVEKPPIPEVAEDYYAGGEIRLIGKKSYGDEALRQLQTDPNLDEKTREHFLNMSVEKREQLIGDAVARLWRLQQKIISEARAKNATEPPGGRGGFIQSTLKRISNAARRLWKSVKRNAKQSRI